jgi:hypothetical protein
VYVVKFRYSWTQQRIIYEEVKIRVGQIGTEAGFLQLFHFAPGSSHSSTAPDLLMIIPSNGRSRDSVVGIATDYGLDDRGVGVHVPVGSRMFSTS